MFKKSILLVSFDLDLVGDNEFIIIEKEINRSIKGKVCQKWITI